MLVNLLYHGSLGFRVQEGFHVEGDLFVLDRFYGFRMNDFCPEMGQLDGLFVGHPADHLCFFIFFRVGIHHSRHVFPDRHVLGI